MTVAREQTAKPVSRVIPRQRTQAQAQAQAPSRHDFTLLTSSGARAAKRALDLAGCLVLVIPLLVVIPLVAIAIKIDSKGPVLFRQQRVGRGGTTFKLCKFRSMHVNAEERLFSDPELEQLYLENGFKLPADQDPRITRVGRLLRKLSLDELPQFWNTLVGDMSLVGPRPILPQEVEVVYSEPQRVCLQVKPGLTGLWQVSGRSSIVGEERAELDVRYVETWTFGTDVLIMLRTIPAVLTARGAH